MVSLASYLASVQAFDWMRNCCHFCGGWLKANGQPDPMEGLPVTPNLMATRRVLRDLGGSLSAAVTLRLGRDPIPATLAQTGDIVHMNLPDGGEAVGICNGRHAVFLMAGGGFAFEEMSKASCAWRLACA
jgi:hypothetical protein